MRTAISLWLVMLIGIFVVVVVLLPLLGSPGRRSRHPDRPRRSGMSRALGVVGLLVGVGLVAWVFRSTLVDLEERYAQATKANESTVTMRVPALTVDGREPVSHDEAGRALVQFFVIDASFGAPRITSFREFDVDLGPQSRQRFTWEESLPGGEWLSLSFETEDVRPIDVGHARPRARGGGRLRVQSPWGSSSSGGLLGSLREGMPVLLHDGFRRSGEGPSLSLERSGAAYRCLFGLYTLLRPEEELDELGAARLADVSGITEAARERWRDREESLPSVSGPAVGGMAFAFRFGVPSVILLIAGLFLSLSLPRRAFPFASAMLIVVLALVAFDRYRVQRHLEVLARPDVGISERAVALDGLQSTFFFGETAREVLETYGLRSERG